MYVVSLINYLIVYTNYYIKMLWLSAPKIVTTKINKIKKPNILLLFTNINYTFPYKEQIQIPKIPKARYLYRHILNVRRKPYKAKLELPVSVRWRDNIP